MSALRLRLTEYLQSHGIEAENCKKFKCIHPEHNDQNPSMNVHKSGTYAHCFSCNRSADIFAACAWIEGKAIDGTEFVKDNVLYLADKFSIKYHLTSRDDARTALKYAYLRAYKLVCQYLKELNKDNPTEAFTKELSKRKWAKLESLKQGLGGVHRSKDILDLLYNNGYTREFIDLIGLNRPDIFNADSFIYSIFDEYGRPIAFYSRDTKFEEKEEAYKQKVANLELTAKKPAKYNSTANFTGIYEKPLVPYGIHDCKNSHKVIVVEGHGCRHSLRINGINNVIALGGTALSEQTIDKLSSLGVTNLVLLLDNDTKGREKLASIIRSYYGKSSMEFSVLDMAAVAADVKDPDEFIRKYSVERFLTIKEQHALEWVTLTQLAETKDPYTVLQEITPLVALERSPISRLRLINSLAQLTGVDREIISAEVDQKISSSKDRRGEYAVRVLDEAKELLQMSGSVDGALSLLQQKFELIMSGDNNEDLYSANEVLKSVVKLQEAEESDNDEPVIKTGFEEWDKEIPLPVSEGFVLVMGPPNTGKTAMFNTTASKVLEANSNTMVIINTIDDSRDVYINRLVAGMSQIKINWVRRPSFYLDEDLGERRQQAYRKVAEWIREERLIIKDVEHGNSVEYLGKLIKYYRNKYPTRNILVFLDNFHRMNYEGNELAEGRHKYKATSALTKGFTTKYNCNIIATVEMTKEGMYDKPKDARAIAEAASLQFDANLIIYLWNDLNVNREKADLYFESSVLEYLPDSNGYIHKPMVKPIIEGLVLKNKLSEFKGVLYWRFHPELALYEECTSIEVQEILDARKSTSKEEVKKVSNGR